VAGIGSNAHWAYNQDPAFNRSFIARPIQPFFATLQFAHKMSKNLIPITNNVDWTNSIDLSS